MTPYILTEVEKVSSFKFLGVFIKDDLTWSTQADLAVKTAQKHLYFLRRQTCMQKLSLTFTGAPLRASSLAALLPGSAAAPLLIARPSRGW